MKHDFADGKYTVINDNGKLTALLHGEPWARSLVGDKARFATWTNREVPFWWSQNENHHIQRPLL